MTSEVPHEGIVTLLDHGASQPMRLWHRVTGEVAVLANRHTLDFDESGIGFLVCCTSEVSTWINEKFDRSLHTEQDDQGRA